MHVCRGTGEGRDSCPGRGIPFWAGDVLLGGKGFARFDEDHLVESRGVESRRGKVEIRVMAMDRLTMPDAP